MNTLKKSVSVVTTTTGHVVSDVLMGVLKVITNLTSGAEDVLTTLGHAISELGEDVKVVAHHTAEGAGNLAQTIAGGLGDVVRKVPLAGKPTAYVVKKAGTGIHYVVLTLSDIVGTVSKTAGKGVKAGTKVVVFTLGQGKKLSATVLTESNRLVQSVLGKVNKLSNVKTKKAPRHRRASHKRS